MSRQVELTIDKLVYGGYGLAFAEDCAYFILNALPGERVRVEIMREKKNTAFGKAISILSPSPLRTAAPCPHFMRCGGCHLQHLHYPDQLKFKEGILRETFRRIGQIALNDVEVVPSEPWHYRTRAQFKVARHAAGVEVGFFAAQSHRVWSIDQCPLLADRLNQWLASIQEEREKFANAHVTAAEFQLRTNHDQSQVAMDFAGQPPELDFAASERSLVEEGLLIYHTSWGDFRIGSNSFFQINRTLLETVVEKAVKGEQGATALDLYAGVGLFTVALSRQFKCAVAVEGNPGATGDLKANLKANGCTNVEVIGGDVSSVVRWQEQKWDDIEFVLLDPPRQGVDRRVIEKLLERQIKRCVYVSCDPTSMARDLKLLRAGGFQLIRTVLLDFFPQTYHFETVAHLERVA